MKHKPFHKIKLDLNEYSDDDSNDFEFVDCPSCKSQVDADGINLDHLMAKCNSCNAVFSIDDVKTQLKTKHKSKQPIERPEGVEKFYFGEELDLTVNQTGYFLEWYFAFFFPFMALGFFGGWTQGVVPLFVPILCLVIAIVSIVSLITKKRHLSHIRVNRSNIDVIHRPNKFKRNVEIETSQVEQIYVANIPIAGGGKYALKAVVNGDDGQKHKVLLKGIKTVRAAKYMEQEIESYLGIENQEMLEEVK